MPLGEVTYCPACWGPGQIKMDKHGKPYLRCGSGCRIFTVGTDAVDTLSIVSDWISQTLARMETDAAFRETMRGIVTQHRRSLRALLTVPTTAPQLAMNTKKEVA